MNDIVNDNKLELSFNGLKLRISMYDIGEVCEGIDSKEVLINNINNEIPNVPLYTYVKKQYNNDFMYNMKWSNCIVCKEQVIGDVICDSCK